MTPLLYWDLSLGLKPLPSLDAEAMSLMLSCSLTSGGMTRLPLFKMSLAAAICSALGSP